MRHLNHAFKLRHRLAGNPVIPSGAKDAERPVGLQGRELCSPSRELLLELGKFAGVPLDIAISLRSFYSIKFKAHLELGHQLRLVGGQFNHLLEPGHGLASLSIGLGGINNGTLLGEGVVGFQLYQHPVCVDCLGLEIVDARLVGAELLRKERIVGGKVHDSCELGHLFALRFDGVLVVQGVGEVDAREEQGNGERCEMHGGGCFLKVWTRCRISCARPK